MNERELFNTLHDEILDYVEDDLLLRCANWGYEVHQLLLEHKMYIMQEEEQGEQSSPFIYAVATAVIVGEFAKHAYNDYYSDETNLLLDELDLEFEQVSGFLNKDIDKDRFEMLKEINGVSLQDIWDTICVWKKDIHKSLVKIYKQQDKKDPDEYIFQSLSKIFELTDEDDIVISSFSGHGTERESSAYAYISNGFQY